MMGDVGEAKCGEPGQWLRRRQHSRLPARGHRSRPRRRTTERNDAMSTPAKADVDDILMQVTIHNRAAEAASLHVLPQLWARNIWSWKPDSMRPQLLSRQDHSISVDHIDHGALGWLQQ